MNPVKITEHIAGIINRKAGIRYYTLMSLALFLIIQGAITAESTIMDGMGEWNLDNTVAWGAIITSFVFWIGIGHAGTLISAILYLFRQKWRLAINRPAEAMTIIAVLCAAVLPILHTGRPWFASYWLFSAPNSMDVWANFKSPLTWDVFAIGTYLIVSCIFWYIGLIPDLAVLKNHLKSKMLANLYRFFSFRWVGTYIQWNTYRSLYKLLAGLAAALVISVHTIVSLDFATGIVPGWHSTIFPPYFVAGAIFSGSALVVAILIITRYVLGLEDYISKRHFEKMNKLILATSLIVAYSYIMEIAGTFWNDNIIEQNSLMNKISGDYSVLYWPMIVCNVVLPQLFWFKKIRQSIPVMFIIALLINIGMWLERYIIVVASLTKDFLPSRFGSYMPSCAEVSILAGTVGLFLFLYLLFIRFFPVITMFEIKSVKNK